MPRLCRCLLVFMLLAGTASAGPWAREVKGAFLSFSTERDRDGNSHTGLYGEYGLTPRNTFGFELGRGNAGETSALIWLRRALDRGEGADRWAISVGVGGIQRDGALLPVGQIAAGWGRGLDTVPVLRRVPEGGWLSVETRVKVAGAMRDDPQGRAPAAGGAGALAWLTPEIETKTELTLGWRATSSTMLVNQIRFEDREDTGFSGKLAASLVHDLIGPAKVELGLIAPFSGSGEAAVRLGSRLEF